MVRRDHEPRERSRDPNQYVAVAMVEQGGFGADVAAPIVRRVIDYLNGNADPVPVRTAPAPVKKND